MACKSIPGALAARAAARAAYDKAYALHRKSLGKAPTTAF